MNIRIRKRNIIIFIIFGIVVVACIVYTLRTISQASKWITIRSNGGPLGNVFTVKIEEYGSGLIINSWDNNNRPDWFEGFKAANGLGNFNNYQEVVRYVSKSVIEQFKLTEDKFNERKSQSANASRPDFSVDKVIYINSNVGKFALVSCWNNSGESRVEAKRRVESDGKTKYLGSWVNLKNDAGRFVLVTNLELKQDGVMYFPYAYPEILDRIMAEKQVAWDSNRSIYKPVE